ncbi:phosphatidylserine synthase 1 [Patella vulgata]|uniref:phosphatidylserine synthase 1 n=1 Tax=Patella vulgata TaxID=6465 RepID=UPI0021800EFE|nr:phosphatidylserine synthase 1 [Patella vulgata]
MATRKKDNVIAEELEYFRVINERSVDAISLDFFYKPHTITLLAISILGLVYTAFTRNDNSHNDNIQAGLCSVVFFFLIISVLAFPNGPFTRPHPAIWRMVFGVSVLYFMMLLFILFQSRQAVRQMMIWLFHDLRDSGPDTKEYAVNCSQITWGRLYSGLDVFAVSHFLGWTLKAILIRHYGILWTISIMWELTEAAYAHLLPNFAECWWDSWILDVLLCNGLGIWCGMVLCRRLEMRNYHWESIKDIHSATGKLRRAVLQFTPVSWTHVRWLDPNSTKMRIIAVWMLIVFFQLVELNTFFLKHVFMVPPPHMLNAIRLVLICLISAPSIRQYYVYVTDTQCKRVGTQCWIFCAITLTETCVCIKFGLELFKQTEYTYVIYWIVTQMIGSFICIFASARYGRYLEKWKMSEDEDESIVKDQKNVNLSNGKSRKSGKSTLKRKELTGHMKNSTNGTVVRHRENSHGTSNGGPTP